MFNFVSLENYSLCVEKTGFMLSLTHILLGSNNSLHGNWSCKYNQLTAQGRSMLKTDLFKMIVNFARYLFLIFYLLY